MPEPKKELLRGIGIKRFPVTFSAQTASGAPTIFYLAVFIKKRRTGVEFRDHIEYNL